MKEILGVIALLSLVALLAFESIFAGFVFIIAIIGFIAVQSDENLKNEDLQKRKFIKSTKKQEKKEYFSNGSLKSDFIYDDKNDCWVTRDYYENNVLKREQINYGSLRNRRITKNFGIDGVLVSKSDYTSSRRTFIYYYKNGNVQHELITESDGKVVEEKYFNEDGTLISTERPND